MPLNDFICQPLPKAASCPHIPVLMLSVQPELVEVLGKLSQTALSLYVQILGFVWESFLASLPLALKSSIPSSRKV